MKFLKKHIYIPGILLAVIFAASGCNNDRSDNASRENIVYLSVSPALSGINKDKEQWEDRVDELRMLVFETGSGEVIFNEPLYFPDGFAGRSNAVRLTPGTYDFCFIANETAYAGFDKAIMAVTNKSDLSDNALFGNIAYDPDFTPDGTTSAGRMVMSALYDGIEVARGGTYENPVLLPLPNSKVELIRPLAKVEVIFRKKVSGSDMSANPIGSVRLDKVASLISVPPLDDYYTGATLTSNAAATDGFDYSRDSIGSVTFYIPEFLVPEGGETYTSLNIDNKLFPINTINSATGMAAQRRSVPTLSPNSVIRNYHYVINAYATAEGVVQLEVHFEPWKKEKYTYMFEGDFVLVIPPIESTDSSFIMPTDCGRLEIISVNEELTGGLQGAFGDTPDWSNKEIIKGSAPYYCEKKYGEGWRLINSCELLSFLAACDMAYRIWASNTWNADGYIAVSPMSFRKKAQNVLEGLTGIDLSDSQYADESIPYNKDQLPKLNLSDMLWKYFAPGDVVVREMDFPEGWPYPGQPGTPPTENWYYNEMTINLKPFWESGYVTLTNRKNWDKVMYKYFYRYDYSSTVSRCVRSVE